MNKDTLVWHSGPPPHVGWWNASVSHDQSSWRWWNGVCWSKAAYDDEDAEFAARRANIVYAGDDVYCGNDIRWTHYYPDNAQVPRVDPNAPTAPAAFASEPTVKVAMADLMALSAVVSKLLWNRS